jgi:hypothetical protein
MKRLALIGLLLGKLAFASEDLKGFSFNAGLAAIASEIGYSVGLNTPINEDNYSFDFAFSQFMVSSGKVYPLIQSHVVNRLSLIEKVPTYFKSGGFIGFPSDAPDSVNIGLHFAFGAELGPDNHWKFCPEIGYWFPFMDQAYSQGASIAMALKYYLN